MLQRRHDRKYWHTQRRFNWKCYTVIHMDQWIWVDDKGARQISCKPKGEKFLYKKELQLPFDHPQSNHKHTRHFKLHFGNGTSILGTSPIQTSLAGLASWQSPTSSWISSSVWSRTFQNHIPQQRWIPRVQKNTSSKRPRRRLSHSLLKRSTQRSLNWRVRSCTTQEDSCQQIE